MTVAPQQLYTFRSSYTTLTYSKDDLRGLIAQIEESFTHSDIYVRALKRLHERLGSQANGLQLLVNALGREAIRLTLRELISTVTQSATVPSSAEPPTPSQPTFTIPTIPNSSIQPSTPLPQAPLQEDNNEPEESLSQPRSQVGITIEIPDRPVLADDELIEEVAVITAVEMPDVTAIAPPVAVASPQPAKAIAPKIRPQPSTEREKILSSIGQTLYTARCQKNISIEQLHQRTCVPSHHIRALEDGIWNNLPEDIYLRGFIRLLGNAVDLNGQTLSQQFSNEALSSPDKKRLLDRAATKVSANHPPSQLHQAHLYLGYAALMVGATGGLAWMVSQPTSPKDTAVQPPEAPNQLSLLNKHNPNQGSFKVLATRIFEQINAIATPETLPPETPPTPITH